MKESSGVSQEEIDEYLANDDDPIRAFFKVAMLCKYYIYLDGPNRRAIEWLLPSDFIDNEE